jgi:hypothetical protein
MDVSDTKERLVEYLCADYETRAKREAYRKPKTKSRISRHCVPPLEKQIRFRRNYDHIKRTEQTLPK